MVGGKKVVCITPRIYGVRSGNMPYSGDHASQKRVAGGPVRGQVHVTTVVI